MAKAVKSTNPTPIKEKMGMVAKRMAESKARFLVVYKKKACNVTEACRAINVDRRTYYDWLENDVTFTNDVDALKEALFDYDESRMQQVKGESIPQLVPKTDDRGRIVIGANGEPEMITRLFSTRNAAIMMIFHAKTIMKERGYNERIDVAHTGNVRLTVESGFTADEGDKKGGVVGNGKNKNKQ